MSSDPTDVRQVRLARNQALFRSVNERVERVSEQYATQAPLGFVCECAIADCGRHVSLTREEYEAIRQNATQFFVLPDHVFPDLERIVEDRQQYVIVEKVGVGGRVAAATHPRQT